MWLTWELQEDQPQQAVGQDWKKKHNKYVTEIMKYEIHIFELQNEEINVKKILAVITAT